MTNMPFMLAAELCVADENLQMRARTALGGFVSLVEECRSYGGDLRKVIEAGAQDATFSPDGTLLGAQGVGREGVDKRIDVLATALRAGMTADDLAELELAYAPPYGSAKDPVNMLGFMMQNQVAGNLVTWGADDVAWARENALIIDVRSPREFASGHLPEAVNIPHDEIRSHLERIRALAAGRPVRVHCASGFRSYLAHRILVQEGFDSANFDGGMLTMQTALPGLDLAFDETA